MTHSALCMPCMLLLAVLLHTCTSVFMPHKVGQLAASKQDHVHDSSYCAGLEKIEVIITLLDVAHGPLTGSEISVGRAKLSPPAWPETSKQALAVSWVMQDGVRHCD